MKRLALALTFALLLGVADSALSQSPQLSDSYAPLLACGNGYDYHPDPNSIRLNGSRVYGPDPKFSTSKIDRRSHYRKTIRERWQKDEAKLKKKFERSSDFRHESDYALALLHNGSTAEALAIFQRLAAAHPEEYTLAANLGTAYELSGKNELALQWIEKAMHLHPESHEGTEWLHVKILKTKLTGISSPADLTWHSVAGVDFGKSRKPSWPDDIENSPEEQERIIKALQYQLAERVQFVEPREPIVAQLLFDLSNAVALRHTVGDAMAVSQLAMKYAEGDLLERIQQRHHYYYLLTDRTPIGQIRRHPWLFSSLFLLVVALATFIHYQKKRQAEEYDEAEDQKSVGLNATSGS